MFPISTWYPSLGQYSFPSVFVELKPDEAQALVERDTDGTAAKAAMSRIQRAMRELPGSCFVCADVCAPTDSPYFGRGRRASYGLTAWRLLAGSEKIRTAFTEGLTNRIVVRPYRRMNRTREFRLFFKDGVLQGASQYHLERHFHRLEGREKQLWRRIQRFAKEIAPFLPQQDLTADVYLSSEFRFFIVDLNPWGPPTEPLLFKTWERDWAENEGLRLIPSPVQMKGEVSVSF